MDELLTMSKKELTRLEVIRRLEEKRMRQKEAAEILGISSRHVRRLLRAYEAEHEEERRAEAEKQAEMEKRKANCARARAYKRGVTQASRVYRTDESGQRFDLTTEERTAAEEQASAEVARWCGNE